MAPNSRAQKVHDELFPNLESSLMETDPEFIAFFDNFAFDEVYNQSKLDKRTRLITLLGALIACQAQTEFKVMLGAALSNGITPVEMKEVVYQATAYIGVAKIIDFLDITNEFLKQEDIQLPLESQSTTTPGNRAELGLQIKKEIVGAEKVETIHAHASNDVKHIHDLLSSNCFGDYYTRKGLNVQTRELLTLSILVAHGGCDGQVKGHIAANLNVGNTQEIMIDVITQLLPYIGYPRTLNGIAAINSMGHDD